MHTCGHAERLTGTTVKRQAARAARASDHVQPALAQVQNGLGGGIPQIDAHAHIAHVQLEVARQTHQGGGARIGLQSHACGHGVFRRNDGRAVDPLVVGQASQPKAKSSLAQAH